MSSYRQRLLRQPTLKDPQLKRLHTDTAQAVNAILDGDTDHVFESGAGPILKDATGHYWRLAITTAGALTTTDLGLDRP
jgi:hypothetical protein